MGLGGWPGRSWPDIRADREKWIAVLRSGKNPIEVRRTGEKLVPTFWECALQLIAHPLKSSLETRVEPIRRWAF
jgi:hypothetical protein